MKDNQKKFYLIFCIVAAVAAIVWIAISIAMKNYMWILLAVLFGVVSAIFFIQWRGMGSSNKDMETLQDNLRKKFDNAGLSCLMLKGSDFVLAYDKVNRKYIFASVFENSNEKEILNYRSYLDVVVVINNKAVPNTLLTKIPGGIEILSAELRFNYKENIRTVKIQYIKKPLKSDSGKFKKLMQALALDIDNVEGIFKG